MFIRETITRDIAVEYDSEQPIEGDKVVRIVFKVEGVEHKRPVNFQEMIRWGQIMNICANEIQGSQPQPENNTQQRVVRGPDGQPVPIDAKLAKKLGMI